MTQEGGARVPRKSDLAVRSVTGIALILVAVACLVYGQEPLWILITAVALVMMAEWATLVGATRWQRWVAVAGLFVPMLLIGPHVYLSAPAVLCVLVGVALAVLLVARKATLAAGVLYCGLPVLSLWFIHDQYDGIDLSFWTLAIVWATDIGAYFAGRAIGGPKLAPVWSPNKTWSGLIGGMIAALAVGMALTTVLHVQVRLAALAPLLAVAAQMGDLFESQMKRRAGVKDSGRLLPGHGGALDRLDGAVPVLCIVALIVMSGVL